MMFSANTPLREDTSMNATPSAMEAILTGIEMNGLIAQLLLVKREKVEVEIIPRQLIMIFSTTSFVSPA
jgi:hypothetical protein